MLCALKRKFAVPVQLPGDSEGRDRWRVVGVERPGGVPVGTTLDSIFRSVTKSPNGLNLSGISTHVFWTLGLKINITKKAKVLSRHGHLIVAVGWCALLPLTPS